MESLPSQEGVFSSSDQSPSFSEPASGWSGCLRRHRWIGFVLPFVVYIGVGAFEPVRPSPKGKPPVPEEQFQEHARPEADQSAAQVEGAEAVDDPQKVPPTKESSEGGAPGEGKKMRGKRGPAGKPPRTPEKTAPSEPAASQALSDQPPAQVEAELPPETNWAGIPYSAYPAVYTLKVLLTCLAILVVWPVYREFPVRVSLWAVLVGVGGWIIWLGFGSLNLEQKWLEPIGLGSFLDLGARSGFNPLRVFQDQPTWMLWGFAALRLFGMVVVVALVEEFFLRGFLMRWVMKADWWEVPIGQVNWAALAACVIYAVLSHPAEMIGATVWFLFITLLAYKTKNIWDCVLAHATTNALLGAYILLLREWRYW